MWNEAIECSKEKKKRNKKKSLRLRLNQINEGHDSLMPMKIFNHNNSTFSTYHFRTVSKLYCHLCIGNMVKDPL